MDIDVIFKGIMAMTFSVIVFKLRNIENYMTREETKDLIEMINSPYKVELQYIKEDLKEVKDGIKQLIKKNNK